VFTPIPAVDIRGGRCVRLVQGDFFRETRYAEDPAEVARHWEAQGARRLHVVDLDGAREGVRANSSVIAALLGAVKVPVQVGGGVRSIDTAQELLDQGADRVIIGTAAAEDPSAVRTWIERLGAEHIVVGIDARDGKVATQGWVSVTDIDVIRFGQRLAALGVRRVVYTDISRDGLMSGPNVDTTRQLAKTLNVIGSGGVATLEHLRALADAGAEAAIIGTALYEGRLTLQDAMAC
jgi:phosphoribosylformimino-5-aminoimidazole carboxamide ribotide isomerase